MRSTWKKRMGTAAMAAFLLTGCSHAGGTSALQETEVLQETEIVQETETLQETTPMEAQTESKETDRVEASADQQNILIAYFTWADNTVVTDQEAAVESAMNHYEAMGDAARYGADAVSTASVVVPGNAARIAAWIQQEVGGDLFSITVEEPYPDNYDECLDRAADEKAENARPALSSQVENFEDYDVIFLGFPNWWYTLPMPVYSFIEAYDFEGKTVVPFCTHGTGGLSATVRDLEAALPDSAEVSEPLGVYRAEVLQAQPEVQEWLSGLGFTQ